MVDRNKFNSILNFFQQLDEHYPNRGFSDMLRQMEELRDSFDIKLLVVGHFSAGKSALLNALLQRPFFLKEAQQPQTAMAAELIYDEQEHAFAYRKENSTQELLIAGKVYHPDLYSHLEYHLNAPALKSVADYTIVDTPGFDSGIKAHSQALSNYIGVGSAYLVVVDQEKGGLDETSLQFIREISHYSDQIAVLINKCDKITADAAEQIVSSAQDILDMNDFPYKVYSTSARTDNCCNQLISIIGQFQAQKAFDRVIAQQLRTELSNTEKLLQIEQRKLCLDTFDLDETIHSYEKSKKQLSDTFERHFKLSKQKIDAQTEGVLAEVRQALQAHADSVTAALLNGNQAAVESIIVETLRPILLASMKDITSEQIDAVASDLKFDHLTNREDSQDLADVAASLAINLKNLIEDGTFTQKSAVDENNEDPNARKKTTFYYAVTGILAAVTDIAAPWLEVVIILLPDIIALVRGLFAESNDAIIKRNFINNVIPQICQKLYCQIHQSIEVSTQQVMEAYKALLNDKLEQLQASIDAVKNQKKQKSEDFKVHQDYLAKDITAVQTMLQQLR